MKVTHEAVREVLRTCGPLTSREVLAFFPAGDQRAVAAVLSTMRSAANKRVYVQSWQRDNGVGKPYLTAVYALGDQPDAPKPGALTNRERCQRWKAKRALGRGVPNSVWQLGGVL